MDYVNVQKKQNAFEPEKLNVASDIYHDLYCSLAILCNIFV